MAGLAKLFTGDDGGGGSSAATDQLARQQSDQIAKANARDAELTAEEEARKRALAGRARGRASLLGPGGEVGVQDLKQTLGG